jgi:hypothetical protein
MSGGGIGIKIKMGCSHRASVKDGRGLYGVGMALSSVQGALDLFLAQPFFGRYEVPRENRENRH